MNHLYSRETQTRPIFTVVIPCYRAATTITASVTSVCGQTEADFELIVVDDGSPDASAAVALAAAAGDKRVRVVRQDNAGAAVARNFGAALGTGRLIAFLDSDDRWAPDVLARHRDHFANHGLVGVSFGRVRFFDTTMTTPGRRSAHVAKLDLALALGENPTCTTSNIAVRRCLFNATGGFDTNLTHAEDRDWLVRVLAPTRWEIAGIDAEMVDYRMSPAGLSADLGKMRAGWEAMMARTRRLNPEAAAKTEGAARALFYRYLARRALRTGQSPIYALSHMIAAFWHGACALLTNSPRRSALTIAGALAATILPIAVVRHAVAR